MWKEKKRSNPTILKQQYWERWGTAYKAKFFGFGGRSTAGGCNWGWADGGIFLEQASLVQAILSGGMCWAPSRGRRILQSNISGINAAGNIHNAEYVRVDVSNCYVFNSLDAQNVLE